ncbi:MAG: membrane dipeptidase [Planctomycetaceae bacterium]|jgi:membrane dipeptidase|nr:membrane dipeptidase [Planctomycetaceae bacterium]
MDRRHFLQTTAALSLASATSSTAQAQSKNEELTGKAALTEQLNPTIQDARNVALSILKPSEKELQRGLELHAASMVFDTYGFSPRAAIDGDRMKTLVEAGASDIEVKDLSEQMTMTRYVTDPIEQAEYLSAWRSSGVTCIFQNAGEEGQDPLRLLKRLSNFTYATDMLKDYVAKAAVPDDITAAKEEGRHCLYFTGNGVPLTQQWVSVEDELRYLQVYFKLGIRMMHLTYQRRNMIGDGCGEPANAGLSDFGRAVIREMNRVGVIPDCAHSGWQTSLEAAQLSEKPLVASHSICGGIYPHIRSKPDEVIKAIADTGGMIGICCIPRYLRGKGDITALLDHIDYAVKLVGVDHVGIGTDVSYNSQQSSAERKKVPSRGKKRADFRSLWPNDNYKTTSEMTRSIAWTNWPLFTVGLVQRGYSDSDIRQIIGGNMLRVCEASLSEG